MKLKHIEVFNAIMISGSISAAARLLCVSQSAVTQTLQHAEMRLGYPLFLRQKNRVLPTEEAQVLYPEIQKLMGQLESINRLTHALKNKGETRLRVAIVSSLSVVFLPRALDIFRKKYPQVPISVQTLHSHEIASAIALQEGDIGIVFGRQRHPGLREEKLGTGCFVYLNRPTNDKLKKTEDGEKRDHKTGISTISFEEFMHKPFIHIDQNDHLGATLVIQWSRLGYTPVNDITVQTHHTAMILAEQGFGPAIIDSFTAMAAQGELECKVLSPEIPIDVCALTPQSTRVSEHVTFFMETVRELVNSSPFAIWDKAGE